MYCSHCGRSCSCAGTSDGRRYPKDPGVYRPLLPDPVAVAERERFHAATVKRYWDDYYRSHPEKSDHRLDFSSPFVRRADGSYELR